MSCEAISVGLIQVGAHLLGSPTMGTLASPKDRTEGDNKTSIEEIMPYNFPNLMRTIISDSRN